MTKQTNVAIASGQTLAIALFDHNLDNLSHWISKDICFPIVKTQNYQIGRVPRMK